MSLKCSLTNPGWGSAPNDEYGCWYEYEGVDYRVGGFNLIPRAGGTFQLRYHFDLPGFALANPPAGKGGWSPNSYANLKEAVKAGSRVMAYLFQRADGHNHIVLYAAHLAELRRACEEEY
jgi:hypothetical protein